jgi:hypothetical protein
MNGQNFFGSICITDLVEKAKERHSAFSKAKNGKIYANVSMWVNEEEDKFGNLVSLAINPSKERKDVDKKVYFGNLKKGKEIGKAPISDNDLKNVSVDIDQPQTTAANENDDLPF